MDEVGQSELEVLVWAEMPGKKARGACPEAVGLSGSRRGLHEVRVSGQAEVIIRAERSEGPLRLPRVDAGRSVQAGESPEAIAAGELFEVRFERRQRRHSRTLDQGEWPVRDVVSLNVPRGTSLAE